MITLQDFLTLCDSIKKADYVPETIEFKLDKMDNNHRKFVLQFAAAMVSKEDEVSDKNPFKKYLK